MRKRIACIRIVLTLVAVTLSAFTAGCSTESKQSWQPIEHTIVVYSFSVQEEVLTNEVFPAFQRYWQQYTGQAVTFRSVFTGSEQIAAAILDGGPADVAILSNEQHAVWLHINNQVTTDWRGFPHQGTISQSPIVIVVRPGNPLGIKDWGDLARPGVKLVHADPHTSGGAQWALLAEYGSVLTGGGGREAAAEQLEQIWRNVVSSPSSSREALREFLFGLGDALVTYEQDALLAQSRGAAIEVIAPSCTIMSEHVAVMVDQNISQWEAKVVEAFVSFLWSETAQEAFTHYYFRPMVTDALDSFTVTGQLQGVGAAEFCRIDQPFTVEDLGGWGTVYPDIIQGIWAERSPQD